MGQTLIDKNDGRQVRRFFKRGLEERAVKAGLAGSPPHCLFAGCFFLENGDDVARQASC
jgi:hypothetical protein